MCNHHTYIAYQQKLQGPYDFIISNIDEMNLLRHGKCVLIRDLWWPEYLSS